MLQSLAAVLVVFGLLLGVLPAMAAQADPTVAEVEAQITALWEEAEPLIEHYNEVKEQYDRNKARQAELLKQIEPLQRQVDVAQLRVGAIAAQVYKGGQVDTINVLLTSESPRALADRLSFVDQFARFEQRELRSVTELKAGYDAQKAPIDELVATLTAQEADLATQKKTIEAKLAALQKLRIKAYGSSGGGIGSYRPWPCPSEYLPTNGYKAASFACKQAGKPYVWAAAGPYSYDCSGLTLAAWKQVGVYLPHNAAAQRRSMPYVSRADLRIGDLVFYYHPIHHVAIYVGDGKVMSAPTFGVPVHMVRIDSSPINSYGRPA